MSTSSSTLTSVLSALGGSTGIDVTSAVNAILYADRAPERGWQAQQSTLASQTSAINALNSDASSLSDALNALNTTTGALTSVTATSSNTSLLSATAAAGTTLGNHTITINNLASTGSWYSAEQTSSSSQLANGSFSITVGSTTTSIPTGTGDGTADTLNELASTINSKSLGVTASVITDSSGSRLSLISTTTGAAGDFSIASGGSIGFTRSGTGADASLTVDGVPITSSTNTVTGAISGVTLNLLGAAPASGSTPATSINLGLAADSSSITSAVSAFVTAFNSLISDVNTTISYNSSTQTAGVLQSDSAAQSLQSALLAATNYSSGSGTYQSLSSLGIETNSDGTLTLDSSKLATAIQSNNAAVTSFFEGSAFNGFAASLNTTLNTYTDPTQGAFTVDLQSISAENKDLTDETNSLEVYLTSQQTILTAQYNAADIAIQQLPQKLKQINALLNPNSSSS